MIVTIHQPEHLPWLGYFYKMMHADLFVILDNVQYRKNYFQNRNQIVTNGKPNYVTVTVPNKNHMDYLLCDIPIVGNSWTTGYLNKIKESYRKHPYFHIHYPEIESIIMENHTSLESLNMSLIEYFRRFLGITTPLVYSKYLGLTSGKSDLVFDICTSLNADVYIAGISGKDYLDLQKFSSAGITIKYDEYQKTPYEQYRTNEFVPYMSTLDLIMNHDKDTSLSIIESSYKLID